MTVGGITGQNFLNKLHSQKKKDNQNETQAGTTFSNNLKENDILSKGAKDDKTKTGNLSKRDDITSVNSSVYSNILQTSMILHESGHVQLQAVVECSAKHISYAESDNVKVCIEEGYTFKAQVQADIHKVYIEKKTDSGEVTGYEINPLELDPDTTDPLEQMALESWEIARRGFMGDAPSHEIDPEEETRRLMGEKIEDSQKEADYADMTIEEAMQKFYKYIEERIKNGDKEYQIGAASMSAKEWDRLLEQIDTDIDAAKEQLREEIRKAKEEEGITKEQIARLFEDKDSDENSFLEHIETIDDNSTQNIKNRRTIFERKEDGIKAPYMELADENGIIEYHGVVFQCDPKTNSICLGDCSAGADYLTISLPDSGGVLKVNRDNISQLMEAITMFSPKDRWAILRAVSTDSYCEQIKIEMEGEDSPFADIN